MNFCCCCSPEPMIVNRPPLPLFEDTDPYITESSPVFIENPIVVHRPWYRRHDWLPFWRGPHRVHDYRPAPVIVDRRPHRVARHQIAPAIITPNSPNVVVGIPSRQIAVDRQRITRDAPVNSRIPSHVERTPIITPNTRGVQPGQRTHSPFERAPVQRHERPVHQAPIQRERPQDQAPRGIPQRVVVGGRR